MEQQLMANAGRTSRQLIAATTRDGALHEAGYTTLDSLERANRADFVVLDADPLENISNVRQVASVCIARNQAAR